MVRRFYRLSIVGVCPPSFLVSMLHPYATNDSRCRAARLPLSGSAMLTRPLTTRGSDSSKRTPWHALNGTATLTLAPSLALSHVDTRCSFSPSPGRQHLHRTEPFSFKPTVPLIPSSLSPLRFHPPSTIPPPHFPSGPSSPPSTAPSCAAAALPSRCTRTAHRSSR